jgi:hypothetical protein
MLNLTLISKKDPSFEAGFNTETQRKASFEMKNYLRTLVLT